MLVDDIALTLQPQIGPRTAAHLLANFGTAEAVFAATVEQLEDVAGLNKTLASRLVRKEYHRQAESEIRFCNNHGIIPISSTSELYPALLRECMDYPHVIYFKGNTEVLSGRMLSMVGTRKMTSYGQKMCGSLVSELTAMFSDLVIVSGLAFGIDAACHRAALASCVPTIGVFANSFPDIVPQSHTMLATEMIKRGGGVMTEFHSGIKNKGDLYFQRNRIIAGLSGGTVIVEAPHKSGAINTAATANGYHRSVMAVPGRVGDPSSEGTNHIIKNNRAAMVCSGEDIANEMMWDVSGSGSKTRYDVSILSEGAIKVLDCIKEGDQISIDELSEISGFPISVLTPLILELEMNGMVRMFPGKIYEKALII